MIQKYFGRVSFLDRGLLISTVFVLEAKAISQVYQLIQAKIRSQNYLLKKLKTIIVLAR
ncbi:hypothetical protein [Leptospira mayottensis]|nr:hypothetical protein [Leptospira mayottensis]